MFTGTKEAKYYSGEPQVSIAGSRSKKMGSRMAPHLEKYFQELEGQFGAHFNATAVDALENAVGLAGASVVKERVAE
jgi:hypothetical protein